MITGGSAGIGQSLAVEYAKQGAKVIYITGRNKAGLEATIAKCNKERLRTDLRVIALELDVTKEDEMRQTLQKVNSETPIDVVIANAGISPEQLKHTTPQQEVIYRKTYDTNITGVLNTIFPLHDAFIARKSGHIVLISSIASFGSIAHPAYSSSKSLITTLGQGLRRDLKQHNVNVTVVCPGFLLTAMTEERNTERVEATKTKGGIIARIKDTLGLSGLPFIRTSEEAANVIYTGLQCNIDVIIFPFRLGFFAWALKFIPFTLQDYIGLIMAKLVYRGTTTASTEVALAVKPTTTPTTAPATTTPATTANKDE